MLIAEQYRPGPERIMAELPGGAVDPGESLADGAARHRARGDLADLVTLAMTAGMTDPGGGLHALPYLMGDPDVRELFKAGRGFGAVQAPSGARRRRRTL